MLGDAIAWALPDLRVAAESTMAATASVVRRGPLVFDPNTGLSNPSETTVLSGEPARLRQPTAVEANVMFGEEDVTTMRFIVDFRHAVTGVEIGDVITFTDADDPEMLTHEFRVVALSMRDHLVTRSYGCELVA